MRFITILLIPFSLACFSQQNQIDSITTIISTTYNDSIKIENYLKISVLIEDQDSIQACNYSQRAYYLSLANLGKLDSSLTALQLFAKASSRYFYTSFLLDQIDTVNVIDLRYDRIGYKNYNKVKQAEFHKCHFCNIPPEETRLLVKRLLKKVNSKERKAGCYRALGDLYDSRYAIPQQAYLNYSKVVKLLEHETNLSWQGKNTLYLSAIRLMGVISWNNMSDSSQFWKCVKILKKYSTEITGSVHVGKKDFFRKITQFYSEGKYKDSLMLRVYADSLLHEINILGNKETYRYWSDMANIYNSRGDNKSELKCFKMALKYTPPTNKPWLAFLNLMYGNTYRVLGELDSAEIYIQKGYKIAKENNLEKELRDSYNNMYRLYSELQDFEKALKYQLLIAKNAPKNNTSALMEELKESLGKEQEIEILSSEKASSEKQRKVYFYSSLTLLFFGLGIIFLLLRSKKTEKKVKKQKEIIEEAHKEITDSINYAQRLQNAILPSFDEVNKHLPNNFILFKPKDVVSGDFYWFEQMNGYSYLAAADCTGHGVPGAMVSIVCSNALNRTVKEFGITEPAKILGKTREFVIETFAKSGENVKDGMDIALCAFSDKKVVYSGANNPLWIIRKTELLTQEQKEAKSTVIQNGLSLIEHKSDKQPIGLYQGMKDFTQEEIDLHPSDNLYFFTDGFADQFGGEKGKKFKYKPFKRLLIDLQTKSMEEQKKLISEVFENWRGDLEQVDDVCIIGVKIE
ncbi:MAG: SpoIIE family protein phosphatase [Flavobacteriales bacterium]|nr:SpoIIE family protein phosphatase [Flavobacteriales bacterium]